MKIAYCAVCSPVVIVAAGDSLPEKIKIRKVVTSEEVDPKTKAKRLVKKEVFEEQPYTHTHVADSGDTHSAKVAEVDSLPQKPRESVGEWLSRLAKANKAKLT